MVVARLLLVALTAASFCLASHSWSVQGGLKDWEDDEPSDSEVLSAVITSIAKWKSRRGRSKRAAQRAVCYRSFGCFRNDGPFSKFEMPASPESINTQFLLFTRRNPVNPDILSPQNASIYLSNYNSSLQTKIVIHGFAQSATNHWLLRMVEALLYSGDMNVISVDWHKGATMPNYVQAVANTRLVARETAELIKKLGYPRDLHLVGFSLGAHIAGFVGNMVNVSRITGLDPAGPLFEGSHPLSRLDASDAEFVDIIHTNGNGLLKMGLGSFEPMGHADFYVNGGKSQLGCTNVFVGAISDIFYGRWHTLCNHRRAIKLFIESIHPQCTFPAFTCENFETFLKGDCFPCKSMDDCGLMGYYASPPLNKEASPKKLFLLTRNQEPYCANQFKIHVSFTKGLGSTYGKFSFTLEQNEKMPFNETFILTEESQEITDQQVISGIIVAHPLLTHVTKVYLSYVAYRGYFYTGKNEWGLQKFILINSNGKTFSFCGNIVLKDGETVGIALSPGDCSVVPQRVPRLVWEVIEAPQLGQPPGLVWKIALDDVYPNGHRSIS